ncbi:MAG: TonB-dependent receptor [Phenylobacterium sp.]|jgi:iron complex outermembrane receptor protein|uniref:TonB-dependent receptor domain-containing protein n=1 Tax=unclassified Phenylobacterium TaxID=2640670 RepID=UPI0008BEBBDF|nr:MULTISPECIES: TonB-dependent receptor [unclassified Phenylobacterium]MBJ7411416.1 TonB-dependent receptor [Phenylobacterium sp.]OHB27431.1 MAG: TonB-dependent receptor [Phenylobacterium sp. RIFCSPHIGHO2_01_FULL_69_31]
MTKGRFFCSASVLAATVALGISTQATAQTAPTEIGEVVVTGSFIRGTPEDAALPVDVISQEDLEKQGAPSTLELIKQLSVSSGVLGDTNQFDPRAQGSEGSGSVNLRGLGAQRTLVLLNGRRMSPNPFGQAGAGIVDTNTLPTAAIGRVEVLKDGAAATYGSDAIGGVVNFITRTNFEGFEVGGSYTLIDGSKGNYDATGLWGHAWENGNILLSIGYQHRSELKTTDRDWASRDYFTNPEGGWSAGSSIAPFFPIGGTPAATGFRADNASCNALGGIVQPGGLPACLFHYVDYDNLIEREDRLQLYGEVNADLAEGHRLHIEALYAKTDVPNWKTSPSYLSLQTPTSLTNPFTTLPPALLAGYFVPASNPGFQALAAANPGLIPTGAIGLHMPGVRYRPLAFGGNPAFDGNEGSSEGLRQFEAFRVSGSLRGDLPWMGIGYDVALTYGQETGRRTGYDTVVSRFQLALRGYGSLNGDSAGGCTAAETGNFTTGAGNTALGCYYFNPFANAIASNAITGQTNPGFVAGAANNPDVVRWFFQQVSTKQTQRTFVWDAVLNGKTGIELAGGDVAWAAGVQFRRDGFESEYNDLSDIDASPCIDTPINGTGSCAVRNGPLMFLGTGEEADLDRNVWAVFGELSIPVTDDIQIMAAIRHEDYEAVGTTTNPKISARWQMADWFALRGSIGTTFRGPALTNLAPGSVTALSFIAGAFRAIDFFGNPDLKPEEATTYSVGGIFDIGNFKGSIDYWGFDFKDPIVGEPSASIVNTMFPGGSTANCGQAAFAGLQSRFTFQGACSTATISRVRTQVVNGPKIKTSGIDFMGQYDFDDVLGGDIRIGGSATYTIEYKIGDFTVEGVTVERAFDAAGFLNYQLIATSLPEWKGQVFAEYSRGPHNLRFTLNYIDSYKDQRTSILAPNPVNGAVQTKGQTIKSTILAELDYRVQLPWETTMTLSVDNLFDQDPAFARLDLNYDPFTGSAIGRTYKVSVKKRF